MPASTKTEGDAETATSESKGWNAIQHNIRMHDEGMMKDFSDDIDALLTFAGLFSAALTAFLGPVIAQLQPDNGQLSAQLLSILVLRGNTDSEIIPFLNSTASSLPRSSTVQPPATSIAINTLWFLSLILSLSAALFGILAKQWCREYLKWYSVLSPARENIMLRQLRYEAWQEWHVTSQIAAIPALLELSLILFFVGLVIYSWTLQTTVFGFVIGAISIILTLTLASTLLPTFYRRSPYKSPTGWAFTRLAHVITRQTLSLGDSSPHSSLAKLLPLYWLRVDDSRKFPSDPEHLRDWRTWDARFALDANMCELIGLLESKDEYSRAEADSTVDAFQVSLLVRALSWVRRGSNDDKLSRDIDDCLSTVYDAMRTPEDSPLHFAVSSYPMRLAMGWTGSHTSVDGSLGAQLCMMKGVDDLNRKHGAFFLQAQPHDRWTMQAGPYLVDIRSQISSPTDAILLTLARKAVALRLRWYIACWINAQNGPLSDASQRFSWTNRIASALCFLRYIPRDYMNTAIISNGSYVDIFANALVDAYRELAQHKAAFCDGLVPMIIGLLLSLGEVEISPDLSECLVKPWNSIQWLSEQNCDLEKLRSLISQVSPVENSDSEDAIRERCHVLVAAANNAIHLVEYQLVQWQAADILLPLHVPSSVAGGHTSSYRSMPALSQETALRSILKMMTATADTSLRMGLRDCGAFVELPWLRSLVKVYERAYAAGRTVADVHFTSNAHMQESFAALLAVLSQCAENDLLDGTEVRNDFIALIALLEQREITPNMQSSLKRVRASLGKSEERTLEQLITPKITSAHLITMAAQWARISTVDTVRHINRGRLELLQNLSLLADRVAEGPSATEYEEIFSTCAELWRRENEMKVPEFRTAVCNIAVKLFSSTIQVASSAGNNTTPASNWAASTAHGQNHYPPAPRPDTPFPWHLPPAPTPETFRLHHTSEQDPPAPRPDAPFPWDLPPAPTPVTFPVPHISEQHPPAPGPDVPFPWHLPPAPTPATFRLQPISEHYPPPPLPGIHAGSLPDDQSPLDATESVSEQDQ